MSTTHYTTSFSKGGRRVTMRVPIQAPASETSTHQKPSVKTATGTYCSHYDRNGREIRVFIPNN